MILYLSDRHIPLVFHGTAPLIKPVLTVENYCKWYNYYLVRQDGMVVKVHFSEYENVSTDTLWYDHVPNPHTVRKVAKHLRADVDEEALEMIIGRYMMEVRNEFLEDEEEGDGQEGFQ